MVQNYEVSYNHENTTEDVGKYPIVDSNLKIRDPILKFLPVKRKKKMTFYSRSGGTLKRDNGTTGEILSCGSASLPLDCEISNFETVAGEMDGLSMNSETVTVRYRAKWDKVAGQSNPGLQREIRIKIYHVTTGGVETQIGAATTTINQTMTTYTKSITINKSWTTNELLRVRVRGFLQDPGV